MRIYQKFGIAMAALLVAAVSALTLGAGKGPPMPPVTGDFSLQVSAEYRPAATTSSAHPKTTRLTGTGLASADATSVTVTISGLSGGSTTATVLVPAPLTRDSKNVNKFSGAGTAVVTVGGVDTTLDVTIKGQLVESKAGKRIEGEFYTAAKGKGAASLRGQFSGSIPPAPATQITGTFTLKVEAVFVPASQPATQPSTQPATQPGDDDEFDLGSLSGIFLKGTGSGSADATGVTITLGTLSSSDGKTTTVVTFANPLARSTSKPPDHFNGTGTAAVTTGTTTVNLNLKVQGHFVSTGKGPKIVGEFFTVPPATQPSTQPTPPQLFGEFQGPVTAGP